jgi:hypothetical protein
VPQQKKRASGRGTVARFANYAVSLLLVTLWGTRLQQLCATRRY